MQGVRIPNDSPSGIDHRATRDGLALATAVLVVLAGVVALFWAQADARAVLHEWKHMDSGLSMIVLGALVLGPLLAFGLDD
ncbi:hypothetical protein ACU4GI_22730 [Cupriavidus basilensis]|uniref:hypothetical protein n=1 Tax=Cupriavidus TaxID=106589 RepID=UPI0004521815|nr:MULTISPECIES: hypothetical protein [Cupriavidus]KDP88530.1 hypothetical protein CF70_029665 [Cupriavidus sp. SK-3]MDF3888132.1 hypothetical protein [Cupriavidus basilensis]